MNEPLLPACQHRGHQNLLTGLFPCSSQKVKAPRGGVSGELCRKCPHPEPAIASNAQEESTSANQVSTVSLPVLPASPATASDRSHCDEATIRKNAISRSKPCQFLGLVRKDERGRSLTKNTFD